MGRIRKLFHLLCSFKIFAMRIYYFDNQGVNTISHWFLMAMKQFIIFLLDMTVNFIPIKSNLSILEITLHLNNKWILLKYSLIRSLHKSLFFFCSHTFTMILSVHIKSQFTHLDSQYISNLFLWLAKLVSSWPHNRSQGHSFFCCLLSCNHPAECIAFCLFTHSSSLASSETLQRFELSKILYTYS